MHFDFPILSYQGLRLSKGRHDENFAGEDVIFPKRCACTSLSLSLFLSLFTFAKTVWIQIRPDWNSGKNVSSICDGKYAKCRTKADVHDKMGCQYISMRVYIVRSMRGSRGVRTPSRLKNHKNKEFLSNTGPDPLKFSKL